MLSLSLHLNRVLFPLQRSLHRKEEKVLHYLEASADFGDQYLIFEN
jgi:hypothetical protein